MDEHPLTFAPGIEVALSQESDAHLLNEVPFFRTQEAEQLEAAQSVVEQYEAQPGERLELPAYKYAEIFRYSEDLVSQAKWLREIDQNTVEMLLPKKVLKRLDPELAEVFSTMNAECLVQFTQDADGYLLTKAELYLGWDWSVGAETEVDDFEEELEIEGDLKTQDARSVCKIERGPNGEVTIYVNGLILGISPNMKPEDIVATQRLQAEILKFEQRGEADPQFLASVENGVFSLNTTRVTRNFKGEIELKFEHEVVPESEIMRLFEAGQIEHVLQIEGSEEGQAHYVPLEKKEEVISSSGAESHQVNAAGESASATFTFSTSRPESPTEVVTARSERSVTHETVPARESFFTFNFSASEKVEVIPQSTTAFTFFREEPEGEKGEVVMRPYVAVQSAVHNAHSTEAIPSGGVQLVVYENAATHSQVEVDAPDAVAESRAPLYVVTNEAAIAPKKTGVVHGEMPAMIISQFQQLPESQREEVVEAPLRLELLVNESPLEAVEQAVTLPRRAPQVPEQTPPTPPKLELVIAGQEKQKEVVRQGEAIREGKTNQQAEKTVTEGVAREEKQQARRIEVQQQGQIKTQVESVVMKNQEEVRVVAEELMRESEGIVMYTASQSMATPAFEVAAMSQSFGEVAVERSVAEIYNHRQEVVKRTSGRSSKSTTPTAQASDDDAGASPAVQPIIPPTAPADDTTPVVTEELAERTVRRQAQVGEQEAVQRAEVRDPEVQSLTPAIKVTGLSLLGSAAQQAEARLRIREVVDGPGLVEIKEGNRGVYFEYEGKKHYLTESLALAA